MSSHPQVFHYQTSKKYSRNKPDGSREKVPQEAIDGGILPKGFQPADTDILCGRGKAFANHPGNKNFSDTVRENLYRYVEAPKRLDKSAVVASVVSEILNSGARFVKQEKISRRWYQMNKDQAHEKTGHAIRDLIKNKSMAGENSTPSGSKSKSAIHRSTSPASDGSTKKMKRRSSKSPRGSTSLEPINVLNREFFMNAFESGAVRNLSLTSSELLTAALKVPEHMDESSDISDAPSLPPVVPDIVLSKGALDVKEKPRHHAEQFKHLDEVAIFCSDDFLLENDDDDDDDTESCLTSSGGSDASAAFIDDLSVADEVPPGSMRARVSTSPLPDANDFARVYEILSSDDDCSTSTDSWEQEESRRMSMTC
jgi:hypothetical protein